MEQIRQQVIAMQRRVHDLLDKPTHAAASRLKSELQHLEDELQVGKNARSIEDRMKRVIQILEGEAKSAQIMNLGHLDMLKQGMEQLRTAVQRIG
jgi:hypothetical protein